MGFLEENQGAVEQSAHNAKRQTESLCGRNHRGALSPGFAANACTRSED